MNENDINPLEDGITHLNIWTKAKTQLGQDLSHFAGLCINHPQYGYFRTLEGFWHWLATGKEHDIFRRLDGWAAKVESRNGHERLNVNNFEEEIRKANRLRIEQHPFLKEMLIDSTLPFEHYYIYNNAVTTLDQLRWIPKMLEELRSELQLNKVFDKDTGADKSYAEEDVHAKNTGVQMNAPQTTSSQNQITVDGFDDDMMLL